MATKIYIAGKITGDPNYKAKFAEAENFYKKRGYTVLTPTWMPQGMQPADYMRICFAMIDTADVVAFLPGYNQSAGAEVEHSYCCYIDKNIRHYADDISKSQCAAEITAELLSPVSAPLMPDPAEEIKKALEKEIHKGLYPNFLREG